MQQPAGEGCAWGISAVADILPACAEGLQWQCRRRFDNRVAALVAFAVAAAATYLLLRCALFLAKTRSSSGGDTRNLANDGEETDTHKGDACAAPAEEGPPPASATGAAAMIAPTPAEKVDDISKYYSLRRSLLTLSDLSELLRGNAPLLLKLSSVQRAKCIEALMCLSVVEVASLLTLLGRCERPTVRGQIPGLSKRLRKLRRMNPSSTAGREPRINSLHSLLDKMADASPPAAAIGETERRQRLDLLWQLQERTLQQLRAGFQWLEKSLGVSSEAQKAVAAASAVSTQAQSAANTTADAAKMRVAALVRAIEITVHTRRRQALSSLPLSTWVKQTQPDSGGALPFPEKKGRDEMQVEHEQLLLELQQTPLGRGDDPVRHMDMEKFEKKWRWRRPPLQQIAAPAFFGRGQSRGGDKLSPLQGTHAAGDYISAAKSAAAKFAAASSTRKASARSGASSAPSSRLVPETLPKGPVHSFSAVVSAASAYPLVFPAPGAAAGTAGAAAAKVQGKPMSNSAPAGPSSAASTSSPSGHSKHGHAASSLSLSQLGAQANSSFAAIAARRPVSERDTPIGMKAAKHVGMPYSAATAAMPSSLHRPHSISFPPSSPLPPSSPWPQLSLHPSFDAAATAATKTAAAAPDSSSKLPGVRLRRMQRRGPSSAAVEGTEGDARRGAEKGTEQTKEPQRGTKGSGLAASDWVEENTDDQQG
ncbi:hypothetical protein EBH_0019860 [Eimeria brunetti]|uniref:Uncharacterized protein n=1 Tax=Eimeria brunetti TaxID=51314 RepID=U6LGB2_9EIME|nr:hypothetical protein EBH_0019860 [Eimeria brunetti]